MPDWPQLRVGSAVGLFEDARYRQHSSIIVTNLPFRQWDEFLPSAAQAVAIVDRLVDQATILRFTGKPYRGPRDVHGAPRDGQ